MTQSHTIFSDASYFVDYAPRHRHHFGLRDGRRSCRGCDLVSALPRNARDRERNALRDPPLVRGQNGHRLATHFSRLERCQAFGESTLKSKLKKGQDNIRSKWIFSLGMGHGLWLSDARSLQDRMDSRRVTRHYCELFRIFLAFFDEEHCLIILDCQFFWLEF